MWSVPEGQVYIIRAIATWRQPRDEVFDIYQLVEHAERLDADNATTILGELVHLAGHLDLATNPIHNSLAGTELALHFFDRRTKPFKGPRGSDGLLVIDLVRRYVHIHEDIIWPESTVIGALRRLDFEVRQTQGRWRRVPYQALWICGKLAGSFPRNPLTRIDREAETIDAIWTNPACCREVTIPYPSWPPKPATAEVLRRIVRWTPETDAAVRYAPALAKLNPASDAFMLALYLLGHSADELGDWFEAHAPLCYFDKDDQEHVLSAILSLESRTIDGEELAGALIWLAAKMRRLGYPIPAS